MKPNNKRKENPNNFFARNIREKGEDFLDSLEFNDGQLQIIAISVFRDMVKGKIDIPKYAKYFCDPRIINAFSTAANIKANLYKVTYDGMCALIREYSASGTQIPSEISFIQSHWGGCYEVYQMIYKSFIALSTSGNITILQNLVQEIRAKNYIYNV